MKNKILCGTIIITIIFFSLTNLAFAESEGVGWYVKRNGNNKPPIEKNFSFIERYNGYYVGKGEDKKICLTFDAGYENGNVEKILDILSEKNVKGAFFLLEHFITKNTNLVLRMVNEGHQICNHTKKHKDLSAISSDDIDNEILGLEEVYFNKTGLKMDKYFRFPEGKFSENALKRVSELGYKTVFWSFGYCDWDNNKQPDKDYALKLMLDNLHPGEIMLLHPTG